MTSRRTAKAARAILEAVSSAILFELKDPRVKNVTVTSTEVSPDLRSAKVYVSVMGDAKVQSLTMHGLNSARGFLQSKVADRLQTRHTPILKFILDPGVKQSVEAARILREMAGEVAATSDDDAARGVESGDEPGDDDALDGLPEPGEVPLEPDFESRTGGDAPGGEHPPPDLPRQHEPS